MTLTAVHSVPKVPMSYTELWQVLQVHHYITDTEDHDSNDKEQMFSFTSTVTTQIL